MPVSTIANRRSYEFDALTVLRLITAAVLAATTSEAGVPLATIAPVIAAYDLFKVIVHDAAYTGYANGTAQWTATVEASTTIGGTYTQVSTPVVLNGSAQNVEVALSGLGVDSAVPGAKYLRVTATKTGTPGNLVYGAFVSPEMD